jgi:enolase
MGHHGISSVRGWEVLDSRGRPTVACEVVLAGGARGRASVPSGASTGRYEARELRDGGRRHGGFGVRAAVTNVGHQLARAVQGLDCADQGAVDAALLAADGTPDLARMGANAILAVSVAVARAAAQASGIPLYMSLLRPGEHPLLPLPMVNIISGGAHAAQSIDIQDFLVVPLGADCFSEALEWAARVRAATAELFERHGFSPALVADEGGLSASLPSNRAALELLTDGIGRAGLTPGEQVGIAIDVAAAQLVGPDGRYLLDSEGRSVTRDELLAELRQWCREFPVVSVEDPLADDDWDGWARATTMLGQVQLLGDDLLVTRTARLRRAVESETASAILVKPNQCGTLSAAREALDEAQRAGYAAVVSARSGETEDAWLADLAVGWRSGQIKVGSTMRSDRTAKWNRLLDIEARFPAGLEYAGQTALRTCLGAHARASASQRQTVAQPPSGLERTVDC